MYERWHGTLLDIAVLVLAVCVNTFFAQQLHIIEGCVLVIHLVGFLCIILPLWILSDKATSPEVWTTFKDPGWGNIGLSSLIGIVASVAPLLGADAAGETRISFYFVSLLILGKHIWLKSSISVANGEVVQF